MHICLKFRKDITSEVKGKLLNLKKLKETVNNFPL